MTIVNKLGLGIDVPMIASVGVTAFGFSSATIDAAGEELHMVGELCLEGYSGSKTISSSGGKIHWSAGSVTFVNAGTTVRVGIQDALSASGAAQGDGTFDVYNDLVGGTDSVPSFSTMETAMDTGSVSLSHGQKIAVVFSMTSRGGSDTLSARVVTPANNSSGYLFPCITTNSSGSFARTTFLPNVIIEFDDGTIGWIRGGWAHTASAAVTFNLDTGTADEYGNLVNLQYKAMVDGITWVGSLANTSADFELCLYSDPLGTPSLIEAISVNGDHMGVTSLGVPGTLRAMFSAPLTLNPGLYGVTVRPTTTNSVQMNYFDVAYASHLKANGDYGSYSVRRLDNSGAFSDYNGGTAETRRLPIALSVIGFDDGAGGGGGARLSYDLGGDLMFLRQSTASQEVLLGPFLDDTDGTAETALTIANTDIKLWKNGQTTESNKNSGGATHIAGGRYYAVLDATDTDTAGNLEINVHPTGVIPVKRTYVVLGANVYDSLVAGTDSLDVDTISLNGVACTGRNIGASVLLSSGTGTGQVNLTGGNVTVGTNNDKTGYSLSQAFPANFADLDITATTGRVTAGTVSDKTGYSISGTLTTLDALDTAQDTQHSTTQSAISALNNLSAAQVNAEVVDALNTDTYAEPGQGTPGATISLAAKIGYLFKAWRNRSTQTSTTYSLYNDDATTVDHKATVSDDGTTADKSEVSTGP